MQYYPVGARCRDPSYPRSTGGQAVRHVLAVILARIRLATIANGEEAASGGNLDRGLSGIDSAIPGNHWCRAKGLTPLATNFAPLPPEPANPADWQVGGETDCTLVLAQRSALNIADAELSESRVDFARHAVVDIADFAIGPRRL